MMNRLASPEHMRLSTAKPGMLALSHRTRNWKIPQNQLVHCASFLHRFSFLNSPVSLSLLPWCKLSRMLLFAWQVFDMALTPLRVQFVTEDPGPEKFLKISRLFRYCFVTDSAFSPLTVFFQGNQIIISWYFQVLFLYLSLHFQYLQYLFSLMIGKVFF